MSKVITVTIVPRQITVIGINSRVCIVVNNPVGINLNSWLSNLPEYDSDESAVADGLVFEDWYKTSDNHVGGVNGLAKQVRLQ